MKKMIALILAASMSLVCGCAAGVETPQTTGQTVPISGGPCKHDPQVIETVDSTCTQPGQTVSVCSLCSEEFTEVIPSKGHSFADATCTGAKCCTLCGTTEGEALGHRYVSGQCDRCGFMMPGYEDDPADCSHEYSLTEQAAPTCTTAGSLTYTCSKCAEAYTEEIPASGHSYTDATCESPKTCRICNDIHGAPVGHSFADGSCIRCGIIDPSRPTTVTCSITVRSDKGKLIPGVTVQVYTADNILAATGVTGSKGSVTLTVATSDSYKIVLSDIPDGLSAKESYTFRSTNININLTTISVVTPTDHSKANYKVGSIMGDFTLKDTDGNSYTLSRLLQEKDLVILNFWFVNCGPCKAEFPYFEAVNKEYTNVQLLTLNHIDSERDILALRQQMGVTFPMFQEDIGFQEGFGITAYPTTVFIDSTGRILKIQVGDFKNQQELEQMIQSFLK